VRADGFAAASSGGVGRSSSNGSSNRDGIVLAGYIVSRAARVRLRRSIAVA
jgi:hypothetical protein